MLSHRSRRTVLTALTAGIYGALSACQPGRVPAGEVPQAQAVTCRSRLELFNAHPAGTPSFLSLQAVIEGFQRSRTQCTVDVVTMPSAELQSKLTAAVAGGVSPALTMMPPGWTKQLASAGLITTVDDLFKRDRLQSSDFPAGLWKQMSWNGKLWFMPATETNADFVLFWNKALFSEANLNPEQGPATIAELDAMIPRLTRVQGDEYERVGMVVWDLYGHGNTIQAWGYAFGGSFYDEAKDELTFTHPRIVRAVEWYTGWAQRLGIERVNRLRQAVGVPTGVHFFASGRFGLHPLVSVHLKSARQHDPSLSLGAGPMPGEPPGKTGAVAVGGWVIAAVAGNKQREEAWDFMKYIGASDEGTTILARMGGIPGWLKSPGLAEIEQDPLMKAYVDALRRAEYAQLGFYVPGGWDSAPIQEILDGKRSVVDALETINRDANSRYAQWKSQARQGA